MATPRNVNAAATASKTPACNVLLPCIAFLPLILLPYSFSTLTQRTLVKLVPQVMSEIAVEPAEKAQGAFAWEAGRVPIAAVTGSLSIRNCLAGGLPPGKDSCR
jgi:hypothetical protein